MSEIKEKKVKRKLSKPAIILIVGLIVIAIPCIVFASILLVAQLQKNTPRLGDRFNNDLDPAITQEDVAGIQSAMEAIKDVEGVEVSLAQGQLKVFIDTVDTLESTDIDAIIERAYSIVDSKTPISKYFTSTDSQKMYDLQINVYNVTDAEAENREYKLLHKNAAEKSFAVDDLVHPIDANLASELREENKENLGDSADNNIASEAGNNEE